MTSCNNLLTKQNKLKMKLLAFLMMPFLSGCVTSGHGDFCAISAPIYLDATIMEKIVREADKDEKPVTDVQACGYDCRRSVLSHNEKGEAVCGW